MLHDLESYARVIRSWCCEPKGYNRPCALWLCYAVQPSSTDRPDFGYLFWVP